MKPILFNTDMVRAILDGRKTVTRRVVTPQPVCCGPNITFQPHDNDFFLSVEKHWLRCRECGHDPEYSREGSNVSHHWKPPCQPGDVLYVPEAWKCRFAMLDQDGLGYEVVFRDGKIVRFRFEDMKRAKKWAKYVRKDDNHWQSPYFMPKEAARIFLHVTEVRAERLNKITTEDIFNEGIQADYYISAYSALWDSTIKPADRSIYGWAANPWVWVIDFERILQKEDEQQ